MGTMLSTLHNIVQYEIQSLNSEVGTVISHFKLEARKTNDKSHTTSN